MKVLQYDGPRSLKVVVAPDYGAISDDEVRIESLYSGVSHGSEMNVYRGTAPFYRRKYDGATRLFVPAKEQETWSYPFRSCDPGVWYIGYSNVGRVVEVGSAVTEIGVGDVVQTDGPHQTMVVRPAHACIRIPSEVDPAHGVFLTNLMTAYNGILDTSIKLGDTVVISGTGVLGQLIAQMAKLSGALQVICVDTYETRLAVAMNNGADYTINARTCADIAMEVRKLTGDRGADAVIEASGSQVALNEAIRIVAPDGIVTALSWYQGPCDKLDLSQEFHQNRVTIKCSHTGGVAPAIGNMWNYERKVRTCLQLLSRLRFENLLTSVLPYDEAPTGYRMIDEGDPSIIQVAFKY